MRHAFALIVILVLAVPVVSAQTDEREAMMQADRDFDLATFKDRLEGWVRFFAPNGVMIADSLPPVIGPNAVRERMRRAFADSTFILRWWPTRADVLIPGNVGYTVGRYEQFIADSSGKINKETGIYTTVWKKQPDGSWKVWLDTGEADK